MSKLDTRIHDLIHETLPQPGQGETAKRFARLFEIGREDLSLAKIMEAHWDAIAILQEAQHSILPDTLYAVWASEAPNQVLQLIETSNGPMVSGTKAFCSGAGLIDCALVTVQKPEPRLVLLDFKKHPNKFTFSTEAWQTSAFSETQTATVEIQGIPVTREDCIGGENWYTERVGFWQGSVNPAACWAGGAAGLLDYAKNSKRMDAHTLAHLGAMQSNIWTCEAILEKAGHAIDQYPDISELAQQIGLNARHQIEQLCTDTIRRFARAYGPFPLACDSEISRRYIELDLFLRQCHAERDLESLGKLANL